MKKVLVWLALVLVGLLTIIYLKMSRGLPPWLSTFDIQVNCGLYGLTGGLLYCTRAVYSNYSVKKSWDGYWEVWYFLRPFASAIAGFISYVFLRAGLLLLSVENPEPGKNYGVYAIAFVAGLNVDKFVSKIEEIAKSALGIDKSRAQQEAGK